tara:strand:+ start:7795 stop:9294 length:1500 start_codon:yes stop_codon:yes gene_type:complete
MNSKNYIQSNLESLRISNKILGLDKIKEEKVIFVYCPPRVGSTSLVSTLRLSGGHIYKVLHIHDEQMLKYVGNIHNVKVNDIIQYNASLGREVFVIDIFREPLERKMSEFFGKLASYHFNADVPTLERYDLERIIKRFNNVFPYIGEEDHFLEQYNLPQDIDKINGFDGKNDIIFLKQKNITFLKLRIRDFDKWKELLEPILDIKITPIKDNARSNLDLSDLYKKFKENYKIPINFIQMISESKCFKFYLSPDERENYLKELFPQMAEFHHPFSLSEYNAYTDISSENQRKVDIETDHYFDEGCQCDYCCKMREITINRIENNQPPICKILHRLCYKKVNLNAKIIKKENTNSDNQSLSQSVKPPAYHPDPGVSKINVQVNNAMHRKKDLITASLNKDESSSRQPPHSPPPIPTNPPVPPVPRNVPNKVRFDKPPNSISPGMTMEKTYRPPRFTVDKLKQNIPNINTGRRVYKREDGTFVTFVRNTLTNEIVMKEVKKP